MRTASWFVTTPTDGVLDCYNRFVAFPIFPPCPLGRRFLAKIDAPRFGAWNGYLSLSGFDATLTMRLFEYVRVGKKYASRVCVGRGV